MSCRESYSFPAVIPNGTALSNVIDFREYAYAIIHMPAAWTAASIAFQVCPDPDGTFQPLNDDAAALVEIATVVDESYMIPADVLAARFVKIWSQTGGTGVNQGAARTIVIDMKS